MTARRLGALVFDLGFLVVFASFVVEDIGVGHGPHGVLGNVGFAGVVIALLVGAPTWFVGWLTDRRREPEVDDEKPDVNHRAQQA
jgi:hypothetical protein